ncbi:hypothetical protein STEG23_022242 [Scotinomys teguina]
MVKFLLLTLAFGLAHAHDKLEGKWETIAITADDVEKVEMKGPLRLYVRELTCNKGCSKMEVTFYVKRPKAGTTMVKFLLLALAFGLAHAHDKISGKWDTVAIAADNVEKIENKGPLRLYVREITCNEGCSEMKVTFYVNENDYCSKTKVTGYRQADGTYKTQYEGENTFQPVQVLPKNIVFTSKNVDRAGKETKLIFVIGKGIPMTEEESENLMDFAEEEHIPPENIQDVLSTAVNCDLWLKGPNTLKDFT